MSLFQSNLKARLAPAIAIQFPALLFPSADPFAADCPTQPPQLHKGTFMTHLRLHQQPRDRLISDIALQIRQSLDLNTILQTTVDEVRQFLQTDRVIIFRFYADGMGVVDVESVGSNWTAILSTQIHDPCFSEHYIEPFRRGLVTAKADIYKADLTPCHLELLAGFQVRANLVVPILQRDHLWGLLIAHHCAEPREWQEIEIDLLRQLATHAGIAIQQAELYQQLQAELEERKAAEQTIRQQASLLDICSDAIHVQDLQHRILYWNRSAEKLYGWTAAEAIGQNAENLLYKAGDTSQLETVSRSIAEQGEWQGELRQVAQSGQEILVDSRWNIICDDAGNLQSLLVVNTDITEKKQLEAQFLRAQRLESIGTLASGIAHDLNNVLTPILAVAQLLPLKFPGADPGSRQLFEILELNTKRGAALVKQVLSFARGMEGKRTPLQIKHLLAEVRQVAQQTFPRSIKISFDPDPDLWIVTADATQLHQVLMNLVVNARDAMPEGGKLTLTAENVVVDEHYARMNLEAKVGHFTAITVTDTGTGIPQEAIDHIFEPFFTTKELGKGTGLGLSTVMGIVKGHSGFVNVYSEVGRGTQVRIYIPASQHPEPAPIEPGTLPAGQGELVLVVDDEVHIREASKITLETYGYRVLTACDGIDAIALYAQHQAEIQTVVIDMMMPEMDGITTIRTLKRLNPNIKVIAVSGLGMTDRLVQEVGVTDFLMKPYTAEDLLVLLQQQLSTMHKIGETLQ